MNRFYVDTSVWLDYFEDRGNGIRPPGEFAFGFLKKCKEHQCVLLYSETLLSEIRKFSGEWAHELFSSFGGFLVEVSVMQLQTEEAERVSRSKSLPFNDVLHAILARDNDAVMVTRDRHFEALCDIVQVVLPEDVIFD